MKRILPLVIIVVGLASLPANATMLSVVAAGTLPMNDFGKFGFGGGGLLLEFGGMSKVGFELGGLYEIQNFDGGISASSIKVPGLIRIHLGSMSSLGLGGYYSSSLETGGGSDYGAEGALTTHFRLGGRSALKLEARYDFGLKDFSGYKNKEASVLVGLSFMLGR